MIIDCALFHLVRLILPASVVRRNSCGESAAKKNVLPASAVENWSTALRSPSMVRAGWLILTTFSLFSYTILTSTECGASAVEHLGSLRHWDRQYYWWTKILRQCIQPQVQFDSKIPLPIFPKWIRSGFVVLEPKPSFEYVQNRKIMTSHKIFFNIINIIYLEQWGNSPQMMSGGGNVNKYPTFPFFPSN